MNTEIKMNSWRIDWQLSLKKDAVLRYLDSIIAGPSDKKGRAKELPGNISGNRFNILIKRSIIWGLSFRKEIAGEGDITEVKDGTRLSATFKICPPYSYIRLDTKTAIIVISIFLLSWVGLAAGLLVSPLEYLSLILFPIFFVAGFVLIIGTWRYLFIEEKFKRVIRTFDDTFKKYIKTEG